MLINDWSRTAQHRKQTRSLGKLKLLASRIIRSKPQKRTCKARNVCENSIGSTKLLDLVQTFARLLLTHAHSLSPISTFTMGYEDSVYLAKLAEQAERYEGKPPQSYTAPSVC